MSQRKWRRREDFRPILEKVCKLYPRYLSHVKPDRIFLCSFTAKTAPHIAQIRRISQPWATALKDRHDYLIEFWEERYEKRGEQYQFFVMLHELWHIAVGGFDPESPKYRKLIDHDIQDFRFLLDKFGVNLEKIGDIMKGEKAFVIPKIRRFPREEKLD